MKPQTSEHGLFRSVPRAVVPALLRVVLAAAFLSASPALARSGTIDLDASAKDWQEEFNDICAGVDSAMDMTKDDLEAFLLRCRVLEPRIERLPEVPRKVFGRRLRMCRDLYRFVLDNSGGGEEGRTDGAGNSGAEKGIEK